MSYIPEGLEPLYEQIKELGETTKEMNDSPGDDVTLTPRDISDDLLPGEMPYTRDYYDGSVVRRYMVRNFEVRAVDVDYVEQQTWEDDGEYVLAFDDRIEDEWNQDFYIRKDLLYADKKDAIRVALADLELYMAELENLRDYYLEEVAEEGQ